MRNSDCDLVAGATLSDVCSAALARAALVDVQIVDRFETPKHVGTINI